MSVDNIKSSLGLVFDNVSTLIPLGTNSQTNQRQTTPSIGKTIVGEQVETGDWWDKLGSVAGSVLENDLIQRYVGGKISKELINDGVPLYTTFGNPSDQAGGKLLQDVAVQQANASKTYLLVGGGILAALVVIFMVTRK